MSDALVNAWIFLGVTLMIGVGIHLYVRWNDWKYGKHSEHHQ